jgi:hypothetical protein
MADEQDIKERRPYDSSPESSHRQKDEDEESVEMDLRRSN